MCMYMEGVLDYRDPSRFVWDLVFLVTRRRCNDVSPKSSEDSAAASSSKPLGKRSISGF